MRVARSIAELTGLRAEVPPGRRVGFVATMGALHAGHASLVEQARALSDTVAVSIFVNPLQFGPGEDYARYPRPLEADLERCAALGVDLVFVPAVGDLYPPGRQVSVSAGTMGTVLEGAARPGHFDGVLTVVLKLFNLVRPQVAVFGRKDAQQLACIQRMVLDLNLDVRVVGAPTVREPDGLALSSRNVFLSPTERALALDLPTALERAAAHRTLPEALAAAHAVLDRAGLDPEFDLDYLTAVSPETFAEVAHDAGGDVLLTVAATVGSTRLIDNTLLDLREPADPPAVPRLPSPR
ncbi:pantoate--beta-alanine ligase [Microlunatus flavus]|uniref:Pantothenate synthetase n=1 Tax=Microlunatus flavus TaxID=1036181 RepID=A0A1H9NFS6_9ACTN|nr:pantoate--beta-alanine ligase [Microlunatus flavus]SER34738.1 pantoate--beta-alanine ligase [Microlunatus flavus]